MPIAVAEYVRMSTDQQQYSLMNQSALIHAYAHDNDMEIVATYADPGRSGLTLTERPGLSRLLADVLRGKVQFEAVLVYDVSRWGRFQDADESAHYEFLCKRAGVRVVYCAEQFVSDGTPFAGVLKSLKRAMAGEYSRELGVKISAGKTRVGSLGFRVGGMAGYGLKRRLLEDGVTPGLVLRDHQHKAIQTDRVTLIPGPEEEVRIVRRIYHACAVLGKTDGQIRDELNAEKVSCFGREWTRNLVKGVLTNEKYLGNNIVNRTSQRLRTPTQFNPPEKWTRRDGAFEGIVSREMFDKAAVVRRSHKKNFIPADFLIDTLKLVLKREGKLTAAVIDQAPELPSAQTICERFGTLADAYEKVGYCPPIRYLFKATDRALLPGLRRIEEELLQILDSLGVSFARAATGLITLGKRVYG